MFIEKPSAPITSEWQSQYLVRELSTLVQHATFLILCHSLRKKFISFCFLLGEDRRECVLTMIFMSILICLLSQKNLFIVFDGCALIFMFLKRKKKKPILRLLAHLVGLKVCLSLPSFLPTFNLLVHLHLSIPFGMFLIYTTCVFVGDTIKLHMCVIKTTDVTIFQLEYGFLNALSLWLELFSVY